MYEKLAKLPLGRVLIANPILARVVESASKRGRHAVLRIGYLSALGLVTLVSILIGIAGNSINEMSVVSSNMFMIISFGQLAMAAVSAPIFTAGAITQEKDNETFKILLSTPLSNAQIVYGMLLSRLYFVVILIFSGLPIFLLTQFFGGVTGGAISMSFAVAISTAVFTGSLAISLAVFSSGTSRTVFNFYVCYGLFLIAVWLLGVSPMAKVNVPGAQTSLLTALHPFLSLSAALQLQVPPDPAMLTGASWLKRQWLCRPQYFYICWTVLVALVLPALSAVLLRWRQANMRRRASRKLWQLFGLRGTDKRSRRVWRNPIAWREAATRCSTGGGGLVKWAFFIISAAMALCLLWMYNRGMIPADIYRANLALLLAFEFGLILLIICWFASSAVNRELEDGTLDLLLMSPITSRQYLSGKLRGLVGLSLVLLCVPVATAILQGCYDMIVGFKPVSVYSSYSSARGSVSVDINYPVMPLEGALHIAMFMPAFCSLVALIGLGCSLKNAHLFKAIIKTIAMVVGIIVCLIIFNGVTQSLDSAVAIVATVSNPLSLSATLTMPHEILDEFTELAKDVSRFRTMVFVSGVMVSAIFFVSVFILRRQLEITFDMTIRNRSKS